MSNISKLTDAGIIAAGAALNAEDQNLINSHTPAEVDALISIKSKLTTGFIQRNLSGGGGGVASMAVVGGEPAIGIVF